MQRLNLPPSRAEWLEAHNFPPSLVRSMRRREATLLMRWGAEFLQYHRPYTSKLWKLNALAAGAGAWAVYGVKALDVPHWCAIVALAFITVACDAIYGVMLLGASIWLIERMMHHAD